MNAMVSLANVAPNTNGVIDWFTVASYGMNYVDEKCDLYMHDLFVLNREHDRNDSLLKKVDQVGQAVIGGTLSAANAKIPLLAVGQAFGLVESVNDSVSRSYLFEQVPGIIDDKVKGARLLYRATMESNSVKKTISSEAAAYRAIRDYLNLCLPQTIEGNFLQTYINSKSTVVTPGPASAPATATNTLRNAPASKPKDQNFAIIQR